MKLKFLFLVVLLFSNPPVFAEGIGTGMVQIEHVGSWNGKDLLFFYTTNHSNEPACNTYNKRWVLDLSTSIGRSQYSLLLTAQAAGKEVKVTGTNNCDLWSNSEGVHWVGFPVN